MENSNTTGSDTDGNFSRLLRERGVTPTAPRVKIASVLFARPQHVSADQVMEMANESGRKVSKATVYNTLGLFARKGLIRELVVDSQKVFYDSSTHPHFHYYNPETQELSDVPDDQVSLVLPSDLPPGMAISGVEVVIHLRPETSHA
jgi:Fur family iron response transcriptional regulator